MKKSDAINSNFVLNTTNEIKRNDIKSNDVQTSKSNSDQVLSKSKTKKKSSSLLLSETNFVPEIEKNLKEPLVEDILSDIDELDNEKGDEKDDTFYEDYKRKKPLCRIYDSTKKKYEIKFHLCGDYKLSVDLNLIRSAFARFLFMADCINVFTEC